jgi:hypothetical protein
MHVIYLSWRFRFAGTHKGDFLGVGFPS